MRVEKTKDYLYEIKDRVINFYYHSDLVYTAKSLKEEMTV